MNVDNAQLQYSLDQAESTVDDLSYLVKRLAHATKNDNVDKELAEKQWNT